jgi:epoxyqueuosine reductase
MFLFFFLHIHIKDDDMGRAQEIKDKALELGFSKCGIINVDVVKGFKDKLDERISVFSQSALMYHQFYHLADVRQQIPWAESLVVCTYDYDVYAVPESLKGRIGKAYLFDGRKDTRSDAFIAKESLIKHIEGMGIKAGCGGEHGVTAYRYAAVKAGIGTVRKNNFFYTENGSWNGIDVIAISEKKELVEQSKLKECPPDCNKCASACPTGSLKGPYAMNPMRCISFLTSIGGGMFDMAGHPFSEEIGGRVYGCDVCQTACPLDNVRKWGNKEFPGVNDLGENLTLEKIIDMDDDYYRDVVQPKFWYLGPDKKWVWIVNALTAMKNGYIDEYGPYIKKCLTHANARVRSMAEWTCKELKL